MRYCYICYLLFCANTCLFPQEKMKFYTAVSANYTFGKVIENSEAIGAEKGSVPLPGIGLGAFKVLAPGLYIDASIWYQTWIYRITTRVFNTRNNSFTAGPLLNIKIGTILNRASKCKIILGAGTSVGYSTSNQTEFIIRDSVAQENLTFVNRRSGTITSFLNAEAGIMIPGKKRDYLIAINYSYGLQAPFHAKYTYTQNQEANMAEISGRDSYIGLQFRWFFKRENS